MAGALRITAVNPAYDTGLVDPEALLDRYPTLTGWCDAVSRAGATVHVIQRFSSDATTTRHGVPVTCVADGEAALLPSGRAPAALLQAIATARPDVVHVNGLGFPALVAAIRGTCGAAVAIVVQDHAGVTRPLAGGLRGWVARRRWRAGLSAANAVSFSAAGQAAPWIAAGVLSAPRILSLLESSTTVTPTPREEARRRTGLSGTPLVLWVGRLVDNKDPLTVLTAFADTASALPHAHLAMLFAGGDLAASVRARVAGTPALNGRVTLVGQVPHEAVADYLGAADLFVSGSRTEGSGYALIEAMASGVVPVVTEIPSFAAIAGECGARWPVGDWQVCARAIERTAAADLDGAGRQVRARFERELAWPILGAKTVRAYADLVADGARDR